MSKKLKIIHFLDSPKSQKCRLINFTTPKCTI